MNLKKFWIFLDDNNSTGHSQVVYLASLKCLSYLYFQTKRGVAQPGSAPQWGCGGRRFKSSRPDQINKQNYCFNSLLINFLNENLNRKEVHNFAWTPTRR